MRPFVALALYAEGPTDHRFLGPLLQRAVEAAAAAKAYGELEVGRVNQLPLQGTEGLVRRDRVQAGAREGSNAFHLLFIHADGNGDAARARTESVAPGAEAVAEELGEDRRSVCAVVPVRETEAWAIADGDALRACLSTRATDAELELPADPEAEADPKAALTRAVHIARGGRKSRRKPTGADFLEVLGESVSLGALRSLGSYNALEADLQRSLADLGYVPAA